MKELDPIVIARYIASDPNFLDAVADRADIKGDKGDRGEDGKDGKQGPKGERGERGPAGPIGPIGPMGFIGPKGKDGKDGKDGASAEEVLVLFEEIVDIPELIQEEIGKLPMGIGGGGAGRLDVQDLPGYKSASVGQVFGILPSGRAGFINQSGGGGTSDHGALTGLSDDDHSQYHNDTRGDARYYTQTQLNAGQLNNIYYTETEVDILLSGKANTSHTHTKSQITDFSDADYATAAQGSLAASALQNVVEDTTPQLGGALDLNGNGLGNGAVTSLFIDTTGRIITGNPTADPLGVSAGSVLISTGNSGVSAPHPNADDLIVESAGNTGMSLHSPDAIGAQIRVALGSPTKLQAGGLRYFPDDDDLYVGGIGVAGTEVVVTSSNGFRALKVDASQRTIFGPSDSDALGAEAGSVTISTGDSGVTVTEGTFADNLIVEGSADTGISIFGPDAPTHHLLFGTPGDSTGAAIRWSYGLAGATKTMRIGPRTEAGILRLDGGNANERCRLTNIGTIFSTDGSAVDLLGAASAAVTVSTGDSGLTVASTAADDVIIESSANAGLTIATPNTAAGSIYFGDPEDADVGGLSYNHVSNALTFVANAGSRMALDSGGRMIVGSINSDCLGNNAGSVTISIGDSGLIVPKNTADHLVIENSGAVGMTLACANTTIGRICFADPEDDDVGEISYNHSTDAWVWRAGGNANFTYTPTNFVFGTIASTALGAGIGSVTISTGSSGVSSPNTAADDLIVESDVNAGITICTPNTGIGSVRFADPEDNDDGMIRYNHSTRSMIFDAGNSPALTIESNGTLVVNTTNYETLVTDDDDIPNKKYVDDRLGYMVWAEENGTLSATGGSGGNGVQYSFGNGGTNVGLVLPEACTVTHLTFAAANALGVCTIELIKNGVATGATISPNLEQRKSVALGTPVSFAAGDELNFKTTSVTTAPAAAIVVGAKVVID